MGKRRKCRFSAGGKAKASGKGKTPKQPEKDCDEKDDCSESLETDAKKQKLGIETNEKESAPQTGKYVPPFTASQRVVKSSRLRDRLCLNKTGLNSQENSPRLTDNTQEKFEETTNDHSSKEGHEMSPENSEKNEEIITLNKDKEKDHGMEDSIAHDITEEHSPPADVSVNSGKDEVVSEEGKSTAKESVPVEDIPDEDLGNSSIPAVPEENPADPNQTIDDKEIIIADKINEAENQEHGVLNPTDTVTIMRFVAEVPKLSELLKRSYVNIGEDEKLEKPIATDDLTNHAADLNSERAENIEHVESERENVDIVCDNENLNDSKSNAIDKENLQINSQTDNENQTSEVTLVENDCEVTENAEVKPESAENSSTDLCKNDVENTSEKPSVTITDGGNKPTNKQSDDQKVPDEMLEKSLTPKPEMVVTDKMEVGLELSSIPKETTERCLLDESNCENPDDVTVSTTASNVTVDDLSFAKEFEAIEELFPIDDMGLFDDVIDDQLKSVSFEEEMPKGDNTMEFLINEIASLNCMVANYQKAAEEMKRYYKISCPY